VEDGGEDGALDLELEAAAGEQFLEHGPAADLIPQPLEQQRAADAAAGNRACRHLREDQTALAVPSDRLQQALKIAAGGEQVLAAEWLEDALTDAAARFADALDEVEVAVAAGDLLDDEHLDVLRFVCAQSKEISGFLHQMFSLHAECAAELNASQSIACAASFLPRSPTTVQVRPCWIASRTTSTFWR
jgi:hypothetical protein